MQASANIMKKARIAAAAATVLIGIMAVAPTATAATPTSSATVAASKTYTMNQVKAHKTATNCWSVVNGNVYKLTGWVSKHPGGKSAIVKMCGKNASAVFNKTHGSSKAAKAALAPYKIGKLA